MTPIQELIEWMNLHYKSSKDPCSPTLILFKLNQIELKEKEFARQCFEAGYICCVKDLSKDKDFETFYKQFEQ